MAGRWTLGCLLYEMVVGRGPYSNDDLQLLVKAITTEEPVIPSGVSQPCRDVLGYLMQRDTRSRSRKRGTFP